MSTARLTSAMLASALMRLASRANGFAAIIAKGDATSGALLLQLLEKGRYFGLFERMLDPSGGYVWGRTGPQDTENMDLLGQYLERRRSRDPDLWIVELDIPDAERFIAETLPNA
jgi:hypothetical protein